MTEHMQHILAWMPSHWTLLGVLVIFVGVVVFFVIRKKGA